MASLLQNAVRNGRQVTPLALPVDDIFDALDEDIIRDQYPSFPGHAAANAAWEADRKRSPNRKSFYEQKYGVPNSEETYRSLAALMRSLDRISEPLRDVPFALERLAAENSG
jgi:hypothetical protein